MFDIPNQVIIAASAKLLEKLRKFVKSKEVFDIVQDLQTRQAQLEKNATAAEAKVTDLIEEMGRLKTAHADNVMRLNEAHAQEVARLRKPPAQDPFNFGDIGGIH